MSKGKDICELLKDIRKEVAEKYGLRYEPAECHHTGDCLGTCPRCDEELRDLQRQLEEKGINDIELKAEIGKALEVVPPELGYQQEEGHIACVNPDDTDDDNFMLEGAPQILEGMDTFRPKRKKRLRKFFMECRVAGLSFHDVDDIWDELYEGAEIAIIRDKNNKHDKNAVAVALADDYDGNPDDFDFDFILGYIPRAENEQIATLLDMGWTDMFEAEISKLDRNRPYSDRMHITIYVKQNSEDSEEEEETKTYLRISSFEEDDWKEFRKELWEKGYSYFRWGGFPPWELDLPKKGDKVVFLSKGFESTELSLMTVIAIGDDCAPYVVDIEELHMVDDCTTYALTQVFGPIDVPNSELDFLDPFMKKSHWQPDYQLPKDISEKLISFFQIFC